MKQQGCLLQTFLRQYFIQLCLLLADTSNIRSSYLVGLVGNMRLGWKWEAVTNAVAFNTEILITSVKSFIVEAPEATILRDRGLKCKKE